MEHLYEELRNYGQGGAYPYHMPGHKRRLFGDFPPQLFQMDITEIDGFDNLHAPEGILRDLQQRIAAFYGAEESYCLVGSSTAGILSAVSACLPEGGHILMARNCHKSAYHAAYLRNLRITYLFPGILKGYGIAEAITARQVEEALDGEKDLQAVLIVSPTYEGRIADVGEIARVVHERGKVLIVDEAHGAHLALEKERSGKRQGILEGADIVIQSLHKTLPALTQTGVLHVSGERVNRGFLQRYLHIYQSSSPSYVLMASMDNCMTILEREGEALYETFSKRFADLVLELKKCRNIRILATQCEEGEAFLPKHQDRGKLLLFPDRRKMTGQQLYDRLRERYQLQLEMAAVDFCLAMFTVGDTLEGYSRFRDAVLEIDGELSEEKSFGGKSFGEKSFEGESFEKKSFEDLIQGKDFCGQSEECRISLTSAWNAKWEQVPLTQCVGKVSADFINLYPPGTPLLVPGECFSEEILAYLSICIRQGLNIQGLCEDGASVRCVVGE